MNHEWGLFIVVYLFLGGLSAGLLILSSLATLYAATRFARIARVGAWVAPWPVLAGTGLLVLDLGQPFYFWKLLVAFAPRSPMWLGTWLLALFALVSLPYANLFLPPWLRPWAPRSPRRWRRRLAIAGLPLGVGVGIYTGVLLGVLVARPLWNTPLLAQLFLVSAVSTAAALLLILLRRGGTVDERHVLLTLDAGVIGIELVILLWTFVGAWTSTASARASIAPLTRGVYGWTFWLGVVLLGLLVPLALETAEQAHLERRRAWAWLPRLATVGPFLVVAGGLALRLVVVYAGQAAGLV